MDIVYKHWDGPLYIIPAKTAYIPQNMIFPDGGFILSLPLAPGYFAAHLPFYPILIKLGAFLIGYLKSMLLWPVLFGAAVSCFFYYLLTELKLSKHPLLLSLALLFFTPRYFVLRSVGAPETIFLFFILTSIYFVYKGKYLLAALLGAVATITKAPGILLFPAFGLYFLEVFWKTKKIKGHYLWMMLIPLSLVAVFGYYAFSYGDFWAYFHTHAVVPMKLPFSVFNFSLKWVETGWLEDVYWLFLFYTVVLLQLKKEPSKRLFFYFALVYFLSLITVQHRDISRYSIPLLPMALLAFEEFFTGKKFLLALVILIPALYLYAWNFINFNTMPISDWAPFL